MSVQPLVSVIIPVFNAGPYLREAIQSVLCQDYTNIEIIIIDDGSTDGSVESVKDLTADSRVVVVRQENAGKPAVMNRAIAMARGEFYAVTDADDVSSPNRIGHQVRYLLANLDVAGVFCGYELIINERRVAPVLKSKSREQCSADIAAFRMPGHDPTAMYRMSMVRDCGYSPDLIIVEGLDYILRVGERWPLSVLGETLYSYRIHFASLTRSDPARRDELLRKALKRACDRRGVDFEKRFPPRQARGWRNSDRDNNIAVTFIESVCGQRAVGRLLAPLRTGIQCAALHPLDPAYYKALAYALMPWSMTRRVRDAAAARHDRLSAGRD